MAKIIIPADVPHAMHETFKQNYVALTKNTDNLFLFTCDHKIEHLNPIYAKHFFTIASQGTVGALATHPGLIARYAPDFNDIHYVAKLNGKTNLLDTKKHDPISAPLYDVQDVLQLKENGVSITGIGITIYVGSEYEDDMLAYAAQSIMQAHQHGLIAIVWAYLRGQNIKNDRDPQLLAGAAGLAHSLGADFVKIKVPKTNNVANALQTICQSAGNTKVICSGGTLKDKKEFLNNLYTQMHEGGTHGCAVGRNIFERSQAEAVAISQAISAIVYDQENLDNAMKLIKSLMMIGF